jgi:hypothetical protein
LIVDTNAYVLSLFQVFVCCLIRDFLIPLLVWKNHLKSKSYGYRFWFCVLTQAAFQINLVLLLGFMNICNRYLIIGINCVYYLLVAWNYSDKKFFQRCRKNTSRLWNAYKEERLSKFIVRETVGLLQDYYKKVQYQPVWDFIRRNYVEVLLLGILAVYNIWFLTHNVMLYHCYQYSDIPVHQSWIYELEHGTVFSDGIYPFGMHIMIYMIRIMSCLNLREIMLYAGAYQTILLMIGLYLLAKEIFYAKYTPIAAVIIISFMLNQSRYAASLPQEVGMYALIGLAYFMLRYLRQDRKKITIEGDSGLRRAFRINAYINRRYLGSEAILLMLCVALVIAYHFYTAIAAILLVVSIGLAYQPRILKKQYFIPLMYCGIMGAIIAVLPFGAYLAKGVPFQESMNWATSVIAGEEYRGSDTAYQSALAEAQGWDNLENSSKDLNGNNKDVEEKDMGYSGMTPTEIIRHYYNAILNFGAVVMFGGEATQLMFDCMLIGLSCAIIMLLRKRTRFYGQAYIVLILNMIILCTVGAAKDLGLIEFIAASRASTFAEPFIGLIYMLPVDFAFRVLGIWKRRGYQLFLKLLSAAACAAVAVLILNYGWYHAFFDVNQAYYNESEYLLRHIKKSFDHNTYTIVSPTEEYYDVLDYGYHTELSEFMNMVNGKQKKFTFPTQYVFFFVEKKVMQDYFYGSVEVGLKYAAMDFSYLANYQDYYFQRAIIESQAYYWAQKIGQIYPRSFKVYYEDDIYVAYILQQNVFNPYDLRIDYLGDYEEVIEVNGWGREE